MTLATPTRFPHLQIRRVTQNLDYLRIPLNASERADKQGGVPYWGANGVVDHVNEPLVNRHVVLIGEDGAPFLDPLKPVAFAVNEPIWPNNHIHVLDVLAGNNPQFITYALNSVDYSLYIKGSTRDKLNQSELSSIEIPVPHLSTQQAIADYLDHETAEIETLIADQRKFQIFLEELRSSEISRAFPTEDPVRLKWVLDMAITGPFGTALSASEYITGGVPVINPTHIRRGQIASDQDVSISEEKAAALGRFRMNVGDVILGRKGEVDKAALVDPRFAGAICGSDSMLLRPSTRLHSEYFWWFLQSPQAQSQLQLWSVGSTVQGLNQNTINRIHIPCPPVDMQEQISDKINSRATGIDDLLRETTRVMQLACERRAALITAAVTGQIDVTARHKPAAEQLEDDIAQGFHREN